MADRNDDRGVAGTRKDVIDFDLKDERLKKEIIDCIQKRGQIRVQLIPKGELFMGQVLTSAYEQLID